MSISFNCQCKRRLRASNDMAGRRIRCPNCQTVQQVPRVKTRLRKVEIHNEAEAFAFLFAEHDQKKRAAPPAMPGQPGKPAPPPQPPTRAADAARSAETPEPVEEPSEEVVTDWFTLPELEEPGFDSGQQLPYPSVGGTPSQRNMAIYGGLLVIGVALVWFLGGLAAGLIFYYPPLLLVAGIIALVTGINQRAVRGNGPHVTAGRDG
jgi:hypothetical protein